MALSLDFELRLEDRCGDRVVVSVLLAPTGGPVRIDGVALQLHTRTGETLGVRMLLPISGELHQPMLSTLELRADEVPLGSRVVGTAWYGSEQREAVVPTDPSTGLEVHLRARTRVLSDEGDRVLERPTPAERARLARDYPWIDEPRVPVAVAELQVVENEEPVDDEQALDDLVDELGLDEESSDWLKELLAED